MRVSALIILFIFSISAFAQKHWIIEDNALKWQKVIESKAEIDAVLTWVSTLKDATNVNKPSASILVFQLERHKIDFRKLGLPVGSLPVGSNFPISCEGLIQFKEGRFRILLTNMTIHNTAGKFDNDFSNFLLKKDFSDYRKSGSAVKSLNIYNTFFDDFFTFKPIDDDW